MNWGPVSKHPFPLTIVVKKGEFAFSPVDKDFIWRLNLSAYPSFAISLNQFTFFSPKIVDVDTTKVTIWKKGPPEEKKENPQVRSFKL